MAHKPEVKAVVLAALLQGQGVTEIAQQYNIDKSVVSRWKKALPEEQLQQIATEKKQTLLGLVESHLSTSLEAATALARKASSNDEWFNRQSASEIAVLYGVLSDKSIRILEAADRAREAARASQPVQESGGMEEV